MVWDREDEAREQKLRSRPVSALIKVDASAPPYGRRKGWVPRNEDVSYVREFGSRLNNIYFSHYSSELHLLQDFGDGGAFPEIQVAQYPLGMGVKGKESTSAALAIQLDAEGKIKYDLIARQGHSKDKV